MKLYGGRGARHKPLVAASVGSYGAYLADGSEYRYCRCCPFPLLLPLLTVQEAIVPSTILLMVLQWGVRPRDASPPGALYCPLLPSSVQS